MTPPTQFAATRLIYTLLYCGCGRCGLRLIENGEPRKGTLVDTDDEGNPVLVLCAECASKRNQ